MCSKTKIVLAAAIFLSAAFTASAATKHHASHVHRSAIHNTVPDYNAARDLPALSGAPVRTEPDGW